MSNMPHLSTIEIPLIRASRWYSVWFALPGGRRPVPARRCSRIGERVLFPRTIRATRRWKPDRCGLAPEVTAPVRAHHGAIPQEHPPSGSLGYPAAREAYDEDRALPRHAGQRGVERVGAHGIE